MYIISINYIINLFWISIKTQYKLSTRLNLLLFYTVMFISGICMINRMNGLATYLFVCGVVSATYGINSVVGIYHDGKYYKENDLGKYINSEVRVTYKSAIELEIYRTISCGKDIVIDTFRDNVFKIIGKENYSMQKAIKCNHTQKDILMNGCIMYHNTKVAEIKNGNLNILDKKRCPVLLERTKDINLWLEDRACDGDRNNIKILKRKLGIEDKTDSEVALYNYGMNLTDEFWFKPDECNMDFEKIRQNKNKYESIALGNKEEKFEPNNFTYELTNTGCMEKCWNYQFGKWVLLKNGRKDEVRSESIASQVGEILGFNVVKYEVNQVVFPEHNIILNEVSSCENFTTDNIYLESMYAFIGDDEDYKITIEKLRELEEENNCNLILDYLNMLALDYIVYNVDRHTHNYGVLKNFSEGRIISMAPIYDFNMSLLGNGCKLNEETPKLLLEFFIGAVKYSKLKYDLNKVDFEQLSCEEKVKQFIIKNYYKLEIALKS